MSARDWERDGGVLQHFVGKPLVAGLPTNSIKLIADAAHHQGNYIWIDPPWELLQQDVVAAASDQYPHQNAPDYAMRHKAWGHVVKPLLDGAILDAARLRDHGSVELSFRGGLRLILSDGGEPDASLWYDDWYVKPESRAAEQRDEADEARDG